MTKKKYIAETRRQMQALGINYESYAIMVDTLADILVQRDQAFLAYKKAGCQMVVEHTNKAGATNATKNPLYTAWRELNDQALAYWRELGLSPSSYKKLSGDRPKRGDGGGGLAAALMHLDG